MEHLNGSSLSHLDSKNNQGVASSTEDVFVEEEDLLDNSDVAVVIEEAAVGVAEDRAGELTDSEGEDEFIRKYGEINFLYIRKPRESVWFVRPHALNYFKDGILYRTKGERTSEKAELFLDLMYVAIIANLAGEATANASGAALLKYILLFIPAWIIWADVKDFVNYYYNEDLFQRVCLIWYLVLLVLFANSHYDVLKDPRGAAITIVPYMLCRLTLAATLVVYSCYIPELRFQQRVYAASILVTTSLWIPVIFLSTRGKIGMSIAIFVLEQLSFMTIHHPIFKKTFKLRTSTALNIEHEVERFSVFFTIAIGEFLYKIVATGPLGIGFSTKFLRAIFMLLIAYILFWIYNYGSTARKAVHALRHSGVTAILFIYAHLPLIAAIVLAADAGGDLVELDITNLHRKQHHGEEGSVFGHEELIAREEESEHNMYALAFFFGGGLGVAMICLGVLGLLDVSRDPPGTFVLSRFWRVIWRVPVGLIIALLPFAELNSNILMGVIFAILAVLIVFESIVSTPKDFLIDKKIQPTIAA
ncbi:bacterial low temperature requirement A protein-domain-containing protein [Scheffersomyces xylosifermentans]|uniref:bacterial low temperature requirement A protein-domain-containing protein n=1 Tax=Scheffersomyces xylosifermentans TaxID=1304137 RepID=UPI00315DDD10